MYLAYDPILINFMNVGWFGTSSTSSTMQTFYLLMLALDAGAKFST